MEIKIVISDNDPASKTRVAVSAPGATDFATTQSGAATSSDAPPAEVLRAAAAMGAMSAGPAPALGASAFAQGAPAAFITGATGFAGVDIADRAAISPDHSAGAAPGSAAQMETFSTPAAGD